MKSIYLELLSLPEEQVTFNAINMDDYDGNPFFFGDDEDDDIDADDEDEAIDENLIYMPLERTFLLLDGEQVDVSDVQFSYANFVMKDKTLAEYDDGDIYKEYPIAVSFLMERGDYMRHLAKLSAKDIALVSYSNGTYHSFEEGIEVMDFSAGESVRIIMGFAKEGVPRGAA